MNPSVPDDLISAYFDGEVTPEERAAVEQVLESSSELRQMLDDTSKLSALLHSFPREAPPASLATNVEAQIKALVMPAPPATPVKRTLRREFTAAAAGVMATLASLAVYVAIKPSENLPQDHLPTMTAARPASESSERDAYSKDAGIASRSQPSGAFQYAPGQAEPTFVVSNSQPGTHLLSDQQAPAAGAESSMVVAESTKSNSLSAISVGSTNGMTPVSAFPLQNQTPLQVTGAEVFLPPLKDDFLKALQTGQVFVTRIVNPDHTVMVVELTVLDIEKGTEWMQWMFQKRVIGEIDDRESLVTADRANGIQLKTTPSQANDQKKRNWSDDLIAIYVEGPGEKLAEALSESIELHPELYQDWTPKPPIEISPDLIANVEDDSLRRAQQNEVKSESASGKSDGSSETEAVSAVGNLIVNSYVNSQANLAPTWPEGLSAETRSAMQDVAQNRAASTLWVAQTPESPGNAPNLASAAAPQRKTTEALNVRQQNVGKSSHENGEQALAYAAFRVATDPQYPIAQQNTLLSQGSVPGTHLLSNRSRGNVPLQNRFPQATKSNQLNLDQRDPRRMRMLIVLKQEQPAPKP